MMRGCPRSGAKEAGLIRLRRSAAPPPAEESTPRSRAGRHIRRSARVFGIAVALVLGTLAVRPYVTLNLGEIAPGRAYRSSTPGGWVGGLIEERKIASILNLRGGKGTDRWYIEEVRGARAAGVDFYDLPLSAVRRPTRRELLLLIDVLATARPPVLIHCRAGADRTGMATVVYNLTALGLPPERALEGFSISYGHLALFGTQRLHEPFHEYAAWLESERLPHTPERFRRWVRDDYRAEDPSVDPVPIAAGPRHQV